MFTLTREFIRNLAGEETIYADGFAYYKNGRVTHAVVSKDKRVYQFDVKGNFAYHVKIVFGEDGIEYACNCSHHVKHKGACKHVIASLLFISQFLSKNRAKEQMSSDDYHAAQILDYYVDLETTLAQTDICHISLTLYYQGILRNSEDVIRARMTIGNQKQYKIQNIRKLIESINSGQNMSFGKEFSYRVGVTEFDRTSGDLLAYLAELLELEEHFGISGDQSVFQKNELLLTKRRLLEVLHRIRKDHFTLVSGERVYEGIAFVKGNPFISYDIDVLEDYVALNYSENSRVMPFSASGDLIYYNRVLYETDKIFNRNYLPIYNSLGRDNQPLVFRGENAKRFLEEVLPRLSASMNLQIPDSLKERYVSLPLSASLYLDYVYGSIQARLSFAYGEYEFNNFEAPNTRGVILLRDREQEQCIVNRLLDLGFEPHPGYYLLRDDDAVFRLITGGQEELSEYMKIYYSDSFHKLQVKKNSQVSFGIRGNSGEDFLSLEITYEDVPKEELKELLMSLQMKKRYYRLKNGDFLLLDGEDFANTMEMIQSVDGSVRTMKGDAVQFKSSMLMYLEESMALKGIPVQMDEALKKLLHELRNPEALPAPEAIRAEVRPYQLEGYRWMKNLYRHGFGGILADDMGLGKTLQAIMFLASEQQTNKPSLVVCPSSLMYNWKDELENFAPELSTKIISGLPEERKEMILDGSGGVWITSYPLLRRDLAHYSKLEFHAIFIDEAQNIKNPTSMNAISVKKIKADIRFALTGTPIENSLTELWSIFDYLMPGYLFTHAKFARFFEKPVQDKDETRLGMLNARIQPFILRRMKQDVLKELPEKVEEKLVIELNDEQKKLYRAYLDHYKGEFQLDSTESIQQNRMQILSALMRLRQICCHPGTFLENYHGGSAKLELLVEQISKAVENHHRILIFSQFTSMLDIIREQLEEMGISYFLLEGATKVNERIDSVRQFNEGERDVFLISLKAGGTGLNLIGADTVIHVDPWWNPAVEDQATDRAYRIGQTKNVHVMKLLTKGTIEEKIYQLQKKKQVLADSVITSQIDFIGSLSQAEILEIFS